VIEEKRRLAISRAFVFEIETVDEGTHYEGLKSVYAVAQKFVGAIAREAAAAAFEEAERIVSSAFPDTRAIAEVQEELLSKVAAIRERKA